MAHPIPRRRLPCALPTMLLAAALSTQAQNGTTTTQPDPLDPKASVPALNYESAFVRFRRWSDDKPIAWRQANDTVAGIGGWRVYAREARHGEAVPTDKAPATAPRAAPADPARPSPAGHGGHKTP